MRSVKTPDAIAALRTWLATFDDLTRENGESYRTEGRVKKVGADADHYVKAIVTGSVDYPVTLFYTRGEWSSRCTCEVGNRCKHAYAASLAWIAHVESGAVDGVDPATIEARAMAAPPPDLSRKREVSFGEHWSPVLATKLGRALNSAELRQLDELAALYAELVQAHGTLYPGALLRHGFEYEPPPGAPLYKPAYAGWWDSGSMPTDPWALWQYIAYDYELHGRTIPDVFRPLTDTAAVRGVIEAHLTHHELAAWQHALAAADEPATRRHPALADVTGLRARVHVEGGLVLETRIGASKSWKPPARNWLVALQSTRPVDFEHLTPAEAALGTAIAAESRLGFEIPPARQPLPLEVTTTLLRTRAARDAIVLPDGQPFAIEPQPLVLEASLSATSADRLELRLSTPDGRDASRARLLTLRPTPLYVFEDRVWAGPPPPPPDTPLPRAALNDTRLLPRLRAAGLRLPAALEENIRRVRLRPQLKCWLTSDTRDDETMEFHAQLIARAEDFPFEQHWTKSGWQWTRAGAPPSRRVEEPLLEFDLAEAQGAVARLVDFNLDWHPWEGDWAKVVTKNFPDEFIAWHASLPPGLAVDAAPGLASLLGPPLHAHIEFSATPAPESAGRDWFNLTTRLRVEDTKLTAEEIALLLKARGKWVRLAKHGWQRLEIAGADASTSESLNRLGIDAAEVLADGRPVSHRLHALQLAAEADVLEARDARLAETLRQRVHAIATVAPPPLPAGLRATLRPYQEEGYHFLAHLAALGLGGILADDMGLGKTVQTLAWLLHLAEERAESSSRDNEAGERRPTGASLVTSPATDARRPLRALVVCPKSVVHGWLTETERFAPALHATAFDPLRRGVQASAQAEPQLLVANYSQLRLHADWFHDQSWDAVILDEGQFIKNPGSQVAAAARSLVSRHRFVLTGTPIENRALDLWSLFAFAQPGLLGTQAAFRRQHDQADAAALARLHRRVRHFLLRRTKAQAAPDLPPRTEDDLVVDLEGEQRRLYDAELKRARAQLLGVETDRALIAVRFNVLSSLLRLRQICCHPALVDPAHRHLPSAKLDALLEHVEELRDEGHQVLVFSQFVGMLELIRDRLVTAGIGHLMLTGATENRAELVDTFQSDSSKTVFLLSLKAAGFGLNLTAASYAILYDPWWNPAVEAQAIDRTHRIGQTQPVVAYRLLAADTVEEKIRALQRDKAALAGSIVQEESLTQVLDLESLKRILA